MVCAIPIVSRLAFSVPALIALPSPSFDQPLQDTGSQAAAPAQDGDSNPDSRKRVATFGGRFQLDTQKWPIVGDPDAPQVIVEMFDYTCPYCRANHRWVHEALERGKSNVAVLELAVPINHECNSTVQFTDPAHQDACRLARLSVAVWLANPKKFTEFHDWLFSGNQVPTARDATLKAESLIGKENLDKVLRTSTPQEYVAKQVELYKLVGAGKVPKLLFTSAMVTGDVGSADRILQMAAESQKASSRPQQP